MADSLHFVGFYWCKIAVVSFAFLCLFICSLPIFTLLFFYQKLVFLIAKICIPAVHGFAVNGESIAFALDDYLDKPKFNLVLPMILDRQLDVDYVRTHFFTRVLSKLKPKSSELLYPELRQHCTSFCGCFFWKWDPDFRVEKHIREYDYEDGNLHLPEVCTVRDLERILNHLVTHPWKPNQSMWEYLCIQNFVEEKGGLLMAPKTVIVIRVHHLIGDGRSLIRMLIRDWMQSSESCVPKLRYNRQSRMKKFMNLMLSPLTLPFMFAKMAIDAHQAPDGWKLGPEKSPQSHVKTHISASSPPIPIRVLKKLKNKHETSLNIVVFAFVARGLQKVLGRGTFGGASKSDWVSCLIPAPMPGKSEGFENNFSFVTLKLPTQTNGFEKSVRLLHNETKLINMHAIGAMGYLLHTVSSQLPKPCIAFLLRLYKTPPVLLAVFPGPSQLLRIGEATVEDFFSFIGPTYKDTAMAVASLSYCGSTRICLTMDTSICAESDYPKTVINSIFEEIMILCDSPEEAMNDKLVETQFLV